MYFINFLFLFFIIEMDLFKKVLSNLSNNCIDQKRFLRNSMSEKREYIASDFSSVVLCKVCFQRSPGLSCKYDLIMRRSVGIT